MSVTKTAAIVAELLKPIRPDLPAGRDISDAAALETKEDYLANTAYGELRKVFTLPEIDFAAAAQKAESLLREHTKNLNLGVWLCLLWLKTGGVSGFQNGLALTLGLIRNFSDTLHPLAAKKRARAIEFLNKNSLLHVSLKQGLAAAAPDEAAALRQAFTEFAGAIAQPGGDAGPDLSGIRAIIENGAKAAPTFPAGSGTAVNSAAGEKNAPAPASNLSASGQASATSDENDSQMPGKPQQKIMKDTMPATSEQNAHNGTLPAGAESSHPLSDGVVSPETAPERPLPPEVQNLLEEIGESAPAGIDLDATADRDVAERFFKLQQEMKKFTGTDYPGCIQLAGELLQNYSKDLRVAVWLCIAWFRREADSESTQLQNFRNGLLLILELLKRFDAQLHPRENGSLAKVKTLQMLNNDARVLLLGNVGLAGKKTWLAVTQRTLEGLKAAGVPFAPVIRVLDDPNVKNRRILGEEAFKAFIDGLFEPEHSKVAGNPPQAERLEKWIAEMENHLTRTTEYARINYCITSRVLQRLREAGLPEEIATELATHQDESAIGEQQFLDKLAPVFRDPRAAVYRNAILRMVNQNAWLLLEIREIFAEVMAICQAQFNEQMPKLGRIEKLIQTRAAEGESWLSTAAAEIGEIAAAEAQKRRGAEQKAAAEQQRQANEAAQQNTGKTATMQKPAETSPNGDGPNDPAPVPPGPELQMPPDRPFSERLVKNEIRQRLLRFFEPEERNKESRRIPEDAAIYAMSRGLRWSGLKIGPLRDERFTQIAAPAAAKREFLQQLFAAGNFKTLIPDVEITFLRTEEFVYWLDAQRFVVKALEAEGPGEAAMAVKAELAGLLARLPELPNLQFRPQDKVPFAGAETIEWIESEVKQVFGKGGGEKILPPITGEDYQEINAQYEAACESLPNHFEENARKMQEGINGETRVKGRFLRLHNLANYCYLAKKYALAQIYFNELSQKIKEYNIVEWERALCVSVWRDTFRNNLKLSETHLNEEQRGLLERQQEDLFERIGRYDAVLALTLSNWNQTKGE